MMCNLVHLWLIGAIIGDVDKCWALHDVCCGTWGTTLEGWLRGRVKCMPFVVPRVGTKLTNHYNDCYFRILDLFKYKYSKRRRTTFDHIYADLLN